MRMESGEKAFQAAKGNVTNLRPQSHSLPFPAKARTRPTRREHSVRILNYWHDPKNGCQLLATGLLRKQGWQDWKRALCYRNGNWWDKDLLLCDEGFETMACVTTDNTGEPCPGNRVLQKRQARREQNFCGHAQQRICGESNIVLFLHF